MIRRRRNLLLLSAALLAGLPFALSSCGGGVDAGGSDTSSNCAPAAAISSTPLTTAVVGQQYRYFISASYLCSPSVCGNASAVQLPPGATLLNPSPVIAWIPAPNQANANLNFAIATPPDSCGKSATQSWTVHVVPDTTPLTVVGVSPASGSINVATNITIRVSFSEPIDPTSIGVGSFYVYSSAGFVAGTIAASSQGASFTPNTVLPPGTAFTVMLTTIVKDLSGNALTSNYTSTFTTAGAPIPALSPFHLSGLATDADNQPVSGARVDVYPWVGRTYGPVVSTLTDTGGRYAVDFNAVPDAAGSVAVLLTDKDGYEPDDRDPIIPTGTTAVQDLRIYRILRIAAGDSITLDVAPNDPHCGLGNDWVCRIVRVTTSTIGTLVIDAIPANPEVSGVSIGDFSTLVDFCCSLHQEWPVAAGTETMVYLLMSTAAASESFTVGTSLAP